MNTWSRFNIVSVVLGFAFLYLPIVLLVIFSFNESKLVTVWGGFSTRWYVSLFNNQGLMDAAWVTIRVALLSATRCSPCQKNSVTAPSTVLRIRRPKASY